MATKENKAYRGIVYRVTPIKEKDAMVSCIGEEGFFSFFARGVMAPTSSDFASCLTLSESSFILNVSTQDALRLKEGSLERSYVVEGDYGANMALQAILEILCKAIPEDDAAAVYPYAKASFVAIKEEKDPLTILAIFMAKCLIAGGYGPTLDGCAICGKKNDIVAFSPSNGGLLCRDCAEDCGEEKTAVATLKGIRAVFLCPLEAIGTFILPPQSTLPVLSALLSMAEEATGVRLKGVEALFKY